MRKSDEDWVKECVEYGVECRGLVGISRRTWVECVAADMSKLEIDREDVHDIKKIEKECCEGEAQMGKRTINR